MTSEQDTIKLTLHKMSKWYPRNILQKKQVEIVQNKQDVVKLTL